MDTRLIRGEEQTPFTCHWYLLLPLQMLRSLNICGCLIPFREQFLARVRYAYFSSNYSHQTQIVRQLVENIVQHDRETQCSWKAESPGGESGVPQARKPHSQCRQSQEEGVQSKSYSESDSVHSDSQRVGAGITI